ncbi:uncharacterized protein LOC131594335 [Vicia villosa]|uniref:uncharacterized protein LOC131594335 n=1 Tax=Vicia villosa TaxID=3911 RepID=UPI00273BD405|nr:uncharacterized protein LOC131594335 [Vicia villosa]
MKPKRGKERVQVKEKNLMNKMRKVRILCSDPYATDYSSEEEDLYQLDDSKRIVKEFFVPFMPLAYENKKNALEDVKEVFFQTSPSSVLDVTVTDTAPAKDINGINGSVKESDVKELTGDGKRGNVVEGVCDTEDSSFLYLLEEANVASVAGYDLHFLDEMAMLFAGGFCNLLENEITNDCGSMWKVEDGEGSSILPHIGCDFDDPQLDWFDETPHWDCH